jgi:chromosome segregation ATPase
MDVLKGAHTGMENGLHDCAMDLNQTTKQVDERKQEFSDSEALIHENKCLKAELEKCVLLTSDLTSDVAAAKEETQRYVDELEHSTTRNENLRYEVERLTKVIKDSVETKEEKETRESLERIIDRLKSELGHANSLIDNLRDEKNTLMDRVDTLAKEKGIVSHSPNLVESLLHMFDSKNDLQTDVKSADEQNRLRGDLLDEKAKSAKRGDNLPEREDPSKFHNKTTNAESKPIDS